MNNVAFIWDLDGTLLDSYTVIVDSLSQLYLEQGVAINKEKILFEIISESVASFIEKAKKRFGVSFEELKERYSEISKEKLKTIKPMEGAIEILSFLKERNIPSFLFTHRGTTTINILKDTGLFPYFTEIVTSLNGFPRKPSPEGLEYLINKYELNRKYTYYVGDRALDIECALNAHIKSIMFISKKSPALPVGKENFVIKNLLEIKKIIEK